jgi:lysophospholipase L1-like esterase
MKKKLFALIALTLGIVVAVLIAEGTIRALNLAPGLNRVATNLHRLSNNPQLKYELVPYAYSGYEAINGQGRRDFHYPEKKGDGVFRIAVLGDSVTYGWGTNVWKAHPNMTEYFLNHFQKDGRRPFEVFNFGVRGYGSGEEAEVFRVKALPTNPDLVVIAYNLNDPDPYSVDLAWAYAEMEWADEQFLGEIRAAWSNRTKRFLYEKSALYRLIRYRVLGAKQTKERKKVLGNDERVLVEQERRLSYKTKKEKYFIELTDAYWPTVSAAFDKIAKLCNEAGIPAVVVIFPGLDDLVDYRYGSIHEKVKQEAARAGLMSVDLLPVFQEAINRRPDLEIAIDFDHPATAGQRIAAWEIARNLIEQKMVPTKKEDYEEELFDFQRALDAPDLTYFNRYDMFHLEQGLNNLFFENKPAAFESFKKAILLNPKNKAANRELKVLYQSSTDEALKAKIRKLAH